jgi:hypothetical protein
MSVWERKKERERDKECVCMIGEKSHESEKQEREESG